jgi:predicted NBD/HSP70 family sugar kinase
MNGTDTLVRKAEEYAARPDADPERARLAVEIADAGRRLRPGGDEEVRGLVARAISAYSAYRHGAGTLEEAEDLFERFRAIQREAEAKIERAAGALARLGA